MSTSHLKIALVGVLGACLSVLAPSSAFAHKDRVVVVEKHRPERVWVKPYPPRHAHRHPPRVVYAVPVPPRPYRYYEYDYGYRYPRYGDSLDLGLHTGPGGTYLDLGAGIRLD